MSSTTLEKQQTNSQHSKRRRTPETRDRQHDSTRSVKSNGRVATDKRSRPSRRSVTSAKREASRRAKDVAARQARQIVEVQPTGVEPGLRITLPLLFLLSGYFVGGGVVLLCALDLLFGVPFSNASILFDVGFLFSGSILLYLSWNARDACR